MKITLMGRSLYFDGDIDKTELAWLEAVADANGLDSAWVQKTVQIVSDRAPDARKDELEACFLEWE